MADSNQLLTTFQLSLLQEASQFQNFGDLDNCLKKYQQLLESLLDSFKYEAKGTNKHSELKRIINLYMTKAEEIKTQLANLSSSNYNSNKKSSGSKSNLPVPDKIPEDFNYSISPKRNSDSRKTTQTNYKNKGSNPHIKLQSNNLKTNSKGNEFENQIISEMLDASPNIRWDDIAGLEFAKQTLKEAVILPNLRPDLFQGLRAPPRGVLLFGPPGTGKTLLAKAVATESGFSFFSISASSVTSKYLGEGEKLMKALFSVARKKQPSVIFFDEIDALMGSRKENEHEASRRLKTEFMTQVDGATTDAEDRLLIMAATNLPWEIDEAILRRVVKRIYVPLPDILSRTALIRHLLMKQAKPKNDKDYDQFIPLVVEATDGYSASDLTALCKEAAMGPIREMNPSMLRTINVEDLRQLNVNDFLDAIKTIRPSVSCDSLHTYKSWADLYAANR